MSLELLGAVRMGDLSDGVTDYDYGEKQVVELRAFYESLGKPAEFKPAVDAINAAFEEAKAWEPLGIKDKALRWKNATAMKHVGADASRLMAEIQNAYRGKAAVVPSGDKSTVYDPNAPKLPDTGFLKYLPWIAGGVAVLAVGAVAAPFVAPLLAGRALAGGHK